MAATFLTARRPPRVRGGRALAPRGNLRRISPAPRARSTRGCVLRPRAKTTTPAPPGCSAETMRAAGANGCVSPNPARRVLDHIGGVACVVVHRQVQPSVATVGPTQPIEQFEEQLLVLALSYHPVKATRFRKLSAPEIHTFRLVPGVFSGRRSPSRIQQKPALGFISSGVVLEERPRFLEHRKNIQVSFNEAGLPALDATQTRRTLSSYRPSL